MILTLFKNVLFDMKYIYLINHISVEAPINYCDNYIIANQYSTNRSIDRAIVITSNKNDVRFAFTSSCLQESSCLTYVLCACLHSVVFNKYCVVFLFCFSSSCVPYVASFSGLPILVVPSLFSNIDLQCIPRVSWKRFFGFAHGQKIGIQVIQMSLKLSKTLTIDI